MVSVNPAPAKSVAATRQDANFETRLNATENAIFKLANTLQKFILTNNSQGKSPGENGGRYLTNFSVHASLSETDQCSDRESNCGPSSQKKLSRIEML